MNALWQREFLAFDPVPYLQRIQVPVLAATGAKDLQVDPADRDLIAESVAWIRLRAVLLHRRPGRAHPGLKLRYGLRGQPLRSLSLRGEKADWA